MSIRFIRFHQRRGCYKLCSFHNILCTHYINYFQWKSIWWTKAPMRVSFFAWTAMLWKILTMDKLRKRNIVLVDWCCMCKRSRQSVDHLLLHIEIASAFWCDFFNWVGMAWVMPRREQWSFSVLGEGMTAHKIQIATMQKMVTIIPHLEHMD